VVAVPAREPAAAVEDVAVVVAVVVAAAVAAAAAAGIGRGGTVL